MDIKVDVKTELNEIEVDAYVVLKIIKYSRESKLGLSGALLGCKDVETNKLIVNNCYPLPKLLLPQDDRLDDYEISEEIERQREIGKHISEYMQMISEDFVTVGWYQSSLMGDYINEVTLQNQYKSQLQYPHCVCLIFEVSLADQSLKCFKAIQLTSLAMKTLSKSFNVSGKDLAKTGMSLGSLFREIPIVIRRAHLLQQYIRQEYKRRDLHMNSSILQLFPEQCAINHLMYLNKYLDDMLQDQTTDKRKGKGENPGTYMLGNQILASCKELNGFMNLIDLKQKLLMKLTGVGGTIDS